MVHVDAGVELLRDEAEDRLGLLAEPAGARADVALDTPVLEAVPYHAGIVGAAEAIPVRHCASSRAPLDPKRASVYRPRSG